MRQAFKCLSKQLDLWLSPQQVVEEEALRSKCMVEQGRLRAQQCVAGLACSQTRECAQEHMVVPLIRCAKDDLLPLRRAVLRGKRQQLAEQASQSAVS